MNNIFWGKKYWINLLGINSKDVPGTMIIYGSWFFDKVINRMEKKIEKKSDTLLPNLKIGKIGDKTFFYGVAYGPTMAGELSHMAGILKIKKIILLGTCGGLYGSDKPIFIPEAAVRDDGFSDYYLEKNIAPKANTILFNKTINFLERYGLGVETGKIITVLNMLCETDELIRQWAGKNIKAVDLETATIYSLAHYFKIKCISILIKSDNLIGDEKNKVLSKEEKRKIEEVLIDCAINLI